MTGRSGQRVLAVAARTGRLGCVIIDDGDLVIWDTSEVAAKSATRAARKLRKWIEEFQPSVLVTENPDAAGRKSGMQISILKAFIEVGEELPMPSLVVRRVRQFDNAYLEAAHFTVQFPDLAPLKPEKPPIWGKEPYSLVCFEALALARDAGLLQPTPTGE